MGISQRALQALFEQVGLHLQKEDLKRLRPAYDAWRASLDRRLYSSDLKSEEVAGIFPSHELWRQ
jgi:hypothetical protein